ncbi:uncharacterized protein TRIVIDRAFT_200786 [Trichoderma virens Gv29-8]|uniref:Uncharacterized protein n=1 Tax=Hypocrea virens (strain Gv29-8 / FGSC 10586) TaxID=413071 RepID=G9MQU7_HYPVG|nr:uncharacterized protein TRIVIDRAFT_200786 [Trichoderma virens Gv29-8]EHK22476.1 hypothetical protein TRIVIDRAFT_200786 [Trichoderma virens Gv29-8]UKZ47518.1 hypothetical protein TrVGV298_001738 [Trichoderma virens]
MAQDTEPSGPAVDEEPSSPTLSSPTPVASASASSQPTYTTAGTIYNPSSSQRLQPPARRGRLLKLNSEASGFPLDAAKFGTPRSMLSDAQFRSDASTKVPAATAIQQYSPLQQNYDRAVSPVVSPTHEPGMSFHGVRPHNASLHAGADSPHVSLFDNGKGKAVATNNGSSSDDDDDIVNSALMNMTVKSLQNLASYPNPNQKSAQKALLRGTRPKAGSNLSGGPSRLSTPFTYPNASPGRATNPPSEDASIGFRPILSEPSALYQRTQDRRWRSRKMASEAGASGTYYSAYESRRSTPSTNSDITDLNPSASMHLATGPGAPKPLTAGPPGQRQYRPSTFESTFKALATRSVASQGFFNEAEEDRPSFAVRVANTVPSTPQDSVAEDEEYMSAPELSMNTYNGMPAVARSPPPEYEENPMISPNTLLYLTINSEPDWPQEQRCNADDVYGCTCPAYEMGGTSVANSATQRQGYSGSSGPGVPGSFHTPWQPEMYCAYEQWDEPLGPMFPQSLGYPGRLTVREIQEHNWRLNVMWYAGTGLLGDFDAAQVLSQPTSHNTNPPVAKHIYGAVGEGRPNQAVKESPAAREDGPCSMPIRFVDDDVTDGLALLDRVLSRAT